MQIYNQIVIRRHQLFLQAKVISERQLVENVLFYNLHADDAYNSQEFKPLKVLSQNKLALEYCIIDQNGYSKPLLQTQPAFKDFEVKLNDISMYQKHKYYRKFPAEFDQLCGNNNYKFEHPTRTKLIDTQNVLNRQYYSSFANGHENTSTKGVNPYVVDIIGQDHEKAFAEMEDTNQLEEYLMRFDIFINNLKLTQIHLKNFVDQLNANPDN